MTFWRTFISRFFLSVSSCINHWESHMNIVSYLRLFPNSDFIYIHELWFIENISTPLTFFHGIVADPLSTLVPLTSIFRVERGRGREKEKERSANFLRYVREVPQLRRQFSSVSDSIDRRGAHLIRLLNLISVFCLIYYHGFRVYRKLKAPDVSSDEKVEWWWESMKIDISQNCISFRLYRASTPPNARSSTVI